MLKIGITRVYNIVLGRVLEQSDCKVEVFIQDNKIVRRITSACCPQLYNNTFFIRGTGAMADNDFFACVFKSAEDARQAIEDIKRLVTKANQPAPEPDKGDLAVGLTVIQ